MLSVLSIAPACRPSDSEDRLLTLVRLGGRPTTALLCLRRVLLPALACGAAAGGGISPTALCIQGRSCVPAWPSNQHTLGDTTCPTLLV